MICAYDKNYLEKAKASMAFMLDYVVYDLHMEVEDFFQLFIESGIARKFENGDSRTIAGKSGIELAQEVLAVCRPEVKPVEPRFVANRSPEYWMGYVLAHYQWLRARSFQEITQQISISRIRELYHIYHEMDIRQFVDKMDGLLTQAQPDSNLKKKRLEANLSQKELADITGIPLRMLQEYEQKRKNINKAQTGYVVRLADALCCDIKELLEIEVYE